MTKSGTRVSISWQDGTVSRHPWTVEILRYMLSFWLTAALLLGLAGRYFGSRVDQLRVSLDLCAIMAAPKAFRFHGFNLNLRQSVLCYCSFLVFLMLTIRLHGYRLLPRFTAGQPVLVQREMELTDR